MTFCLLSRTAVPSPTSSTHDSLDEARIGARIGHHHIYTHGYGFVPRVGYDFAFVLSHVEATSVY